MNQNNQRIRNILALECGTWKKNFFLDNNSYSIGRNTTNSLFCYHRVVSRNHATLIRIAYHDLNQKQELKNSFWVIDGELTGNKSTNGIYINGKKCPYHQLQPGDTIFLGGVDVKARYDTLDLKSRSLGSSAPEHIDEDIPWADLKRNNQDSATLQINANQLKSLEFISQSVLILDVQTHQIVNATKNACSLLGYSLDELRQRTLIDLDSCEPDIIQADLAFVNQYHISSTRESIFQDKEGNSISVLVRSLAIAYETRDCYFVELEDISHIKKIEDVLRYQNHHDSLSNIANRKLFGKQLAYAIGYNQVKEKEVAVVQIRFNNHQEITSPIGLKQEKKIQKVLISYLKDKLASMDAVAKSANNNYLVLLDEATSQKIESYINYVRECLQQPIIVDQEVYQLTANFGISVHPQDGEEVEEILKKSTLALDASYQKSLNSSQYYKPKLATRFTQESQQLQLLSQAIAQEEVQLKYQPIININNEEILGLEIKSFALPEHDEDISVVKLLQIAKNTGQTEECTKILLKQIARDRNLWSEQITLKNLTLPILLSSLLDIDIYAVLIKLFNDYQAQIPELDLVLIADDIPDQNTILGPIPLELTLTNFDLNTAFYLLNSQAKLKAVKIPKTLSSEAENDNQVSTFITSILTLGRSLNLNVIAEDISSELHQETLANIGVEIMQGDFLATLLYADDVAEFYVLDSEKAQGNKDKKVLESISSKDLNF